MSTSTAENILYNPVNWILSVLLVYVIKKTMFSDTTTATAPKHSKVIELKSFTPVELAYYNGEDEKPIYMSVSGMVFDVSAGRNFYGPGSMYETFSGRDASRGMAKNSFSDDVLADIHGPIDPLEDLTESEKESLHEWTQFYMGKYIHIGTLVENKAV
ncbi:Dihydrodipicolinate synthase [Batrachochytrium dendrobatidis]|nr:Dihydrodipicolinate synthase [Batrachochytrium dendrobatidis]